LAILISRISSGTVGRPPRGRDFQRQYDLNPARCQRNDPREMVAKKIVETGATGDRDATEIAEIAVKQLGFNSSP
jgi:hypothetical protein